MNHEAQRATHLKVHIPFHLNNSYKGWYMFLSLSATSGKKMLSCILQWTKQSIIHLQNSSNPCTTTSTRGSLAPQISGTSIVSSTTSSGITGPLWGESHEHSFHVINIPAVTLRNDDVVFTSKRRHFDVITSKWRGFDVITTLLLRQVFNGMYLYASSCLPGRTLFWMLHTRLLQDL